MLATWVKTLYTATFSMVKSYAKEQKCKQWRKDESTYWSCARQDNALFGVLYSPMYIDFIQII